MRTLRVIGTKLTLGNAFILDRFALGGENKSKYDKRTIFWRSLQNLDLSVKETKLTLRNAFILNRFALEGKKESKYDHLYFRECIMRR